MRSQKRCGFLAVAVLISTLCGACPAQGASKGLPIQAKAVKPLTLSRVQNMDLGMIVLGPGTWSGVTIRISRTGAFSCTSPNVTCSGAPLAAVYNVTGSNNEVARITAPNVTLTNQANPAQTLTLVVDSPGSVVLNSGGKKGTDFALGGSVSVNSTTSGGLYTGTFNVTVDY